MTALAEADVYFRVGVPFENAMVGKVASAFESLLVVDTREGITLRTMKPHDHGEGLHDHSDSSVRAGTPDPHTWLDPRLAKRQARTIFNTLADLDVKNVETYRSNLEALENDLDSVHGRIADLLRPYSGRKFYVFHPAYGYFADAYGLEQVAVEAEGKGPGTRQLGELIEEMRREDVRTIFVQPQFSVRAAESIAKELGAEVIPLDPLARDYLSNLMDIAVKIKESFPESIRAHGQNGLHGRPVSGGGDE
jgi:zinc transport system substrate-binding protein